MSGKLIVVAGAQFGSEGKGALVDHLTRPERAGDQVVVVRVAGPNAGHTVYGLCPDNCPHDAEHMFNDVWIGHPWKLRAVPVGAVSNPNAHLLIAAGSEVDLSVLRDEIDALDNAGYNVSERLAVDVQATVLEPEHIQHEAASDLVKRLGSTAKGIGAARADRIWRNAHLIGDAVDEVRTWSRYIPHIVHDSWQMLDVYMKRGYTVVVEGTQGFGLGLHAGMYPQCTSSDCRALDFLAMAGVSPWSPAVAEFEVWLATRVRPIRVAGNSGPLKGETTWADLGLPEERTTVTQKIRRVGGWDGDLVRKAVTANGGSPVVRLGLTMVDTMFPELSGADGTWGEVPVDIRAKCVDFLSAVGSEAGASIEFIGTGPTTGLFRPNRFNPISEDGER